MKKVLMKSEVIGELGSRYKVPANIHREFWLSAMKTLSERGMDERLLALLEMYRDARLKSHESRLAILRAEFLHHGRYVLSTPDPVVLKLPK